MSDVDKANPCKIFVGGLTPGTTEEILRAHFGQYGEIVDAVVMKDDHRSRGFGFVTFSDSKAVEDSLDAAPHVIDKREVEAKRAIPRNAEPQTSSAPPTTQTKKVFLGGLSPNTTEDDIKAVVEKFGPFTEVVIQKEKSTDRPRGFGFVTFESPDSVDELCQKKYIKIKDRDVEVKRAVSQEEMRRIDPVVKSRVSGQHGGYRGSNYGGGGRGESYYSSYGRGGGGGGGSGMYPANMGYDYRGYGSSDYPRPESYYAYAGYDRSAAASYAYPNAYGRGYDMTGYAGMYGMTTSAGMGGAYTQNPSSYGPARGYGSVSMAGSGADYGRDRGGSSSRQQSYHPYKRT